MRESMCTPWMYADRLPTHILVLRKIPTMGSQLCLFVNGNIDYIRGFYRLSLGNEMGTFQIAKCVMNFKGVQPLKLSHSADQH